MVFELVPGQAYGQVQDIGDGSPFVGDLQGGVVEAPAKPIGVAS